MERGGGIFKPTIGNESLHHDMDNKGVRILSLPHQRIQVVNP